MEVGISSLLDRFRRLKAPNESVRKEIQKLIKGNFGEEVSLKDIKVVKNKVHLNVSGVLRSEIFLNKEKLLKELVISLNKEAPKDIL